MALYVELIQQDISYHKSCEDAPFPPSFVSQFVQSLQNELKLPRWLESGPVPYTNEGVLGLLDQLRASDGPSCNDLWDDTDRIIDDDFQQRLHVAFNTALADCARIQAVLAAERTTGTPFPKESFLAILVRNAMFNADPRLCSLDDVPVTLPRHFSGESIPILKYMTKSFLAPLIISICEEMPVEEYIPDLEHQPNDGEEDERELSNYSPPTMSEFLDECERTIIHEEEEEEEEDALPPQFEAYFLACSSSAAPPSTCHVPVLCMGDEHQLPVMMSSFLYQRRVWHISDPLVGVEFSKYDTIIKLYVGWLEDDMTSDRVLPRVHLWEIGTPVTLDLSLPLIALAVSRLLCGLEPHISGIRDTIRQCVGAVVSGTQSRSSLSWRIDTGVLQQDLGSNLSRDTIIQWAERQQRSQWEETMAFRKKGDKISLSGSATSKASSQQSTSANASNPTSSPISSKGESLSIPEIREPQGTADSVTTLPSPFSCSAFAATSEKEDYRVFRWMFDRKVVPQCIPSDLEFREKYKAMTGFIWPKTWHVREDLPRVDAALEPCVQELLESVAALETRPDAVNRIAVKDFPVDLRILEQSFSAIFQASRRSREKKELRENVYEASWRVDHDRLLFDFFIRLVQTSEGDTAGTLTDQSVAHLEDPLARPTLETTLRLPRSNLVSRDIPEDLQDSFMDLLSRRSTDLSNWVFNRGGARSQAIEELGNDAYVVSQWTAWIKATKIQTEASVISTIRRLPSAGRCDALGRLVVELPNISFDDISNLQLVRAARKTSPSGGTFKGKSSVKKSRVGTNFSGDEPSTKMSLPDVSAHGAATTTRYNIPSSSISSSSPPVVEEQTTSKDPMNALASKVQKLEIGSNNARLELPILTVEYKKASDNGVKGTNQLRMYLTASVKFLQAIGIRNVPVYGVQTDGPIVVLPAAILRDDDFVYMFERLVERLDISTALGAWHYATILCRLAQNHASALEQRFDEVKESLIASLLGEGKEATEGWTIEYQMAKLTAKNTAK